jgi:hypothetical protein
VLLWIFHGFIGELAEFLLMTGGSRPPSDPQVTRPIVTGASRLSPADWSMAAGWMTDVECTEGFCHRRCSAGTPAYRRIHHRTSCVTTSVTNGVAVTPAGTIRPWQDDGYVETGGTLAEGGGVHPCGADRPRAAAEALEAEDLKWAEAAQILRQVADRIEDAASLESEALQPPKGREA